MDLCPNGLIALIMGGTVWCVNLLKFNTGVTLIIQVCLGIVVYLVLSEITHNESFEYLIEIIKTTLKYFRKDKSDE